MFSCIAAFAGPKVFGCGCDDRYGRSEPKSLKKANTYFASSLSIGISGVGVDACIGAALIIIGALVLAHVIPLPQALGIGFVAGGGAYSILGIGGGVSACVICETPIAFFTTEWSK